ncbi:phage integrase N-terminal SAM-like domain-containing protein [Candidatus Bipolaricaulota bacterium]|nr:phage integrase N-terminal SAM-like domain-containing protein [Candidatus Bipolaricaulota bacterium]
MDEYVLRQNCGKLYCRAKHYSPRAEQAYACWIERFLRFHRDKAGRWTHINEILAADVDSCLTCVQLGVERNL